MREQGEIIVNGRKRINTHLKCLHGKLQMSTGVTVSFSPKLGVLQAVFQICTILSGMGPMPWTVNAEIYPLWARGTASSISTCINWLFNFIVSVTFLTLTQSLTRMGKYMSDSQVSN